MVWLVPPFAALPELHACAQFIFASAVHQLFGKQNLRLTFGAAAGCGDKPNRLLNSTI
jgi:hypothetical protein